MGEHGSLSFVVLFLGVVVGEVGGVYLLLAIGVARYWIANYGSKSGGDTTHA